MRSGVKRMQRYRAPDGGEDIVGGRPIALTNQEFRVAAQFWRQKSVVSYHMTEIIIARRVNFIALAISPTPHSEHVQRHDWFPCVNGERAIVHRHYGHGGI